MSEDLREVLHRAAATPRRDVDADAITVAGRRRRRRRRAATGTLALALVTLVAFFAVGQLQAPDVPFGPDEGALELPPRGEVRPEWLADGTPVFVVHHDDGQISVVEAVSTHNPTGLNKVVGWCASSRTFDDSWHASQWDAHGSYFSGPAPTGLPTYTVQRDGDTVRAQGRNAPSTRAPHSDAPPPTRAGPDCSWGEGAGTRLKPEDRTFHDVDDAPLPVRPPEELGQDGRVVVDGTLVQRDDQPVQMCSTAEGEPPACPPGSPEVVDAEPISGVWRTMTARVVATVTGGDLRDVVMFPDVVFSSMSSDQESEVGDLPSNGDRRQRRSAVGRQRGRNRAWRFPND